MELPMPQQQFRLRRGASGSLTPRSPSSPSQVVRPPPEEAADDGTKNRRWARNNPRHRSSSRIVRVVLMGFCALLGNVWLFGSGTVSRAGLLLDTDPDLGSSSAYRIQDQSTRSNNLREHTTSKSADQIQPHRNAQRGTTLSNSHPLRDTVPTSTSERVVWSKMEATLRQRLFHNQALPATFLETEDHRLLWDQGAPTNTRLLESVQTAATTSQQQSTACQLPAPSSSACHATNYTILAVVSEIADSDSSTSESDEFDIWQRTLFLNCLKWMVDPAAALIFVLLPIPAEQLLEQNDSYGRRLLSWHHQADHPVNLVFGSTLWDALLEFQAQAAKDSSTPDAVLWTSGDHAFRGNHASLQSGFDQWKRQSAALVSSMAWQFQYRPANNDTTSTTDEELTEFYPLPKLRRINATTANAMLRDQDAFDRQFPVMVDLSVSTFHHWDYLCFLQHPALAPLREATDHWDTARFAVGAWLSLVAPSDEEQQKKSLSNVARSTSIRDIRFFRHHVRDEASAQTEVSPAVNGRDFRDSLSSKLLVDERKLKVLSMFGGPPPVLSDEHIVENEISFEHDSC